MQTLKMCFKVGKKRNAKNCGKDCVLLMKFVSISLFLDFRLKSLNFHFLAANKFASFDLNFETPNTLLAHLKITIFGTNVSFIKNIILIRVTFHSIGKNWRECL
jgi:hypothetical protein